MLHYLKYPLKSVRGKIILSFLIFILIPITIIIYNVYSSSQEVVRREVYQREQESVRLAADHIDAAAGRMLNASHLIVNDPEVVSYLQSDTDWTSDYASFQRYASIQKKLLNIRDILLDSNAFVALVDFRGNVLSTAPIPRESRLYEQFREEPWFQEALRLGGWPSWQLAYQGKLNASLPLTDTSSLFVMSRLIKGSTGEQGTGMLVIGLPTPTASARSDTAGENPVQPTLLIKKEDKLLDMKGPVLPQEVLNEALGSPHVAADEQYRIIEHNRLQFVYNEAPLPHLGWTAAQLVSQDELQSRLGRIKNQSLVWLLVWFLLFTGAFTVLMLHFAKRIRNLLLSMDRLGRGDFTSRADVRGQDEVSKLGDHFNRMVLRLDEVIRRLSEEQRRKEEARFQALQAQINPHFLFNTLNSIKWMAMLSGAQHVSQMITKLGKLLQASMGTEREWTTVEEELVHLEMYMDLQKLRFHDNISIRYEVPDMLRRYGILKFTLQPIVENCIIHGGRMPLTVTISAYEEEGGFTIRVADNGKGMEPEQLRKVLTDLDQSHSKYSGIGMRNVNERIKMHFGEDYGITVSSVPDEGTTVSIKLPKTKEADPDDQRADCR